MLLLLPERTITVLQLSALPWFLARDPLQMITLMQSDISVNRYHLETVTNLRKVTYMFSSKLSPNSLLKYFRRTMTHPVYDCKHNTGLLVAFPARRKQWLYIQSHVSSTGLYHMRNWGKKYVFVDRYVLDSCGPHSVTGVWRRHCCEADLQLMLMATMCYIARTQTSCLLSYNDFDHSCRAMRVACRLSCYCS
jgi:hypothetical protein